MDNLISKIEKSHLIIYGKTGTGKTYSVKNQLNIDKYIICNNNTGINYIKNNIINFCKIKKNKLKIIVFDNCECLTLQSQLILRVIMEKYSKKNRFIMICNNYKKLIIPLQSRCAIIKIDNNIDLRQENFKDNKLDIKKLFKNKKEDIINIILLKNYDLKTIIYEYCKYIDENINNIDNILNQITKIEKYIIYCEKELILIKLLDIHFNNKLDKLLLIFRNFIFFCFLFWFFFFFHF
jgi:DNA polymerase III delta prime subunit